MPVNRTENGTNTIYQIVIFELTPISKKVVVNGTPPRALACVRRRESGSEQLYGGLSAARHGGAPVRGDVTFVRRHMKVSYLSAVRLSGRGVYVRYFGIGIPIVPISFSAILAACSVSGMADLGGSWPRIFCRLGFIASEHKA